MWVRVAVVVRPGGTADKRVAAHAVFLMST